MISTNRITHPLVIVLAVGSLVALLMSAATLPIHADKQMIDPIPASITAGIAEPTPTLSPTSSPTPTLTLTSSPTDTLSITIVGNHFVDQNGKTVRLLGVNRPGTQYMCYEGSEFFDGPTDDASIAAMKAWGITAVRVNLNEHCWLGLSDVPSGYGGDAYHQAISDFVNRLNAHGLYVILDMHHSGPGLNSAQGQQPMADRDHAVAYWSSVAAYFKENHAVLFDLFNEPHLDSEQDATAAWQCVRDGGTCTGVGFVAEGMQQMLDAVRATGSTNPVLISGPQYAGTLDRWLEFKPNDPLNQLAASVHIYGQPLGSPYDDPTVWDAQMLPVAAQVPVVIGEIGDTDCTHTFIDRLLPWADAHGVSYLAWSWLVGSCADEPSLITDYNGTPSDYGVGLRDHLLSLPSPTETAVPTPTTPIPTPIPTHCAPIFLPLVLTKAQGIRQLWHRSKERAKERAKERDHSAGLRSCPHM